MSSVHLVCPACQAINRSPVAKLQDAPTCGKCKSNLFPASPITLTDANFQRFVQKSDLPIIVDFWADWCGPCKMMAPTFNAVAANMQGRAIFAKVDTQANPGTSQQFQIRSIPSLLCFKGGKESARQAGAMPQQALTQWVHQVI